MDSATTLKGPVRVEPKQVRGEIWPLAVDRTRLWLITGESSILTKCLPPHRPVHDEVVVELERRAIEPVVLVHSTSWREDQALNAVALTYVAAVEATWCPEDSIRTRWPSATPISSDLLSKDRPRVTVGGADAPRPRQVDVLFHALRHLTFLMHTDRCARSFFCNPGWTGTGVRTDPCGDVRPGAGAVRPLPGARDVSG